MGWGLFLAGLALGFALGRFKRPLRVPGYDARTDRRLTPPEGSEHD